MAQKRNEIHVLVRTVAPGDKDCVVHNSQSTAATFLGVERRIRYLGPLAKHRKTVGSERDRGERVFGFESKGGTKGNVDFVA